MRFAIIISIFALVGCQSDTDWQPIKVSKGNHLFRPSATAYNDASLVIEEWVFDSLCIYDLGNGDQCDWNKLTGRSLNVLTNHENSVMIAWRWDLNGYFWIAPYYHKDGKTYWGNAPCTGYGWGNNDVLKAIRLKPNEMLRTTIRMKAASIIIKAKNLNTGKETTLRVPFKEYGHTRQIGTWFGGTSEAPHTMILTKRTIID